MADVSSISLSSIASTSPLGLFMMTLKSLYGTELLEYSTCILRPVETGRVPPIVRDTMLLCPSWLEAPDLVLSHACDIPVKPASRQLVSTRGTVCDSSYLPCNTCPVQNLLDGLQQVHDSQQQPAMFLHNLLIKVTFRAFIEIHSNVHSSVVNMEQTAEENANLLEALPFIVSSLCLRNIHRTAPVLNSSISL
ncbi:uncharacterized protein BO80DRAFT_86474 [Aspergillus ibericus CBS 121593]|uniref:Uncharacterized protein n=1 Tax=Aspergillus ibericus CBS 121593 TaxID=1448316 RepID=A0A395HG84_9EURO|nr:hypothetical protein BO80DRAFT_86474 [Aspergillus ibericus CBS 121593]RAL05998.1 hypothetical protein BO80DRAFT_86474 [Aspergillus ibericus CBS 121593]